MNDPFWGHGDVIRIPIFVAFVPYHLSIVVIERCNRESKLSESSVSSSLAELITDCSLGYAFF